MAKGGEDGVPPEFLAEALVGDALVGACAGAGWGPSFRVVAMSRHGKAMGVGEPLEEVALTNGLVVGDVVHPARLAGRGGSEDGGGDVVAMDHVEPTGPVAVESGLAAPELLEGMAAAGAVDAGDAEEDGGEAGGPTCREEDVLGLDEDAGRVGAGLGG